MRKLPKFEFDQETHRYTVNGEAWPNVTGLLQEFGLVDYSMVPPDRLEYKRVLGMAVDLACHYLDNGNLDKSSLDARIVPYVEAYEKFCRVTGFEIDNERSSKPMFSRKWRFAGTLDMAGTLDDELVLIDRKCTWIIYESGHIQTAAYKLLFEETYKEKIKKRFLLKLNPNGNYDLYPANSVFAQDQNIFLACLTLYWWKRQHGGTKYDDNA